MSSEARQCVSGEQIDLDQLLVLIAIDKDALKEVNQVQPLKGCTPQPAIVQVVPVHIDGSPDWCFFPGLHGALPVYRCEKAAHLSGFFVPSESQPNDLTKDEW